MYYDSHTHLNTPKLFENRLWYLEHFIQQGWKWLVNVWADDFYNQKALEIRQETQKLKQQWKIPDNIIVLSALAYHPLEIAFNPEINLDNLKNKIENLILENKNNIVAIWETWIDLHQEQFKTTISKQQELFKFHLDLASKLNLPIMIHSRDWFDETFEVLQWYKNLKIYLHCRWYDQQEIEKLLNRKSDIFFGFCGNITYKNAENLRRSIKLVPIQNLLLETDAPYLSPQIVRWTTNEPANVKYIYEYVSNLLNFPVENLQKQIENNFLQYYFDNERKL